MVKMKKEIEELQEKNDDLERTISSQKNEIDTLESKLHTHSDLEFHDTFSSQNHSIRLSTPVIVSEVWGLFSIVLFLTLFYVLFFLFSIFCGN